MIDFAQLKRHQSGPTAPIPIVPEDGLFVFDRCIFHDSQLFQTPTPIIRKFVKCFQRVWKQISELDRNLLTEYWDSRRPLEPNKRPSLVIELSDCDLPRYTIAVCRCMGRELRFDIFSVESATSKKLEHIIAHELGHAVSYARGWYGQHQCVGHLTECVACECQAFSYMAAWGFDPFFGLLKKKVGIANRLTSG